VKNLSDYRLVILDEIGEINTYNRTFGMHQDCLNDFSKKNNYEYCMVDYITKKGNVIFINAEHGNLGVYLPGILNNKQLYMMEYLSNFLGNLKNLEFCKYVGDKVEFSQYSENFSEHFSDMIQSYYTVKKKK